MIQAVTKNEEAQKLVENRDDPTRALALLDDLPANLRDADLYASLCGRRDRVNTLRREIGEDLGARRVSQLRSKIEELSRLQREPISDPLTGRTLLEVVSTHEKADRLAETMRDYAGAIALLDDLPEHLRDGTLYPSLRERGIHAVISKAINEAKIFINKYSYYDNVNLLRTTLTPDQRRKIGLDARRVQERLRWRTKIGCSYPTKSSSRFQQSQRIAMNWLNSYQIFIQYLFCQSMIQMSIKNTINRDLMVTSARKVG